MSSGDSGRFRRPDGERREGGVRGGALMIQGTGSDIGKSTIVAGLCRVARRRGLAVAPFKPQNMSNNAAACPGGGEIGRAQALQARAAGLAPTVDMNPVLLKPQSDRTSQVVVHGRAVTTLEAADYLARRDRLLAPVLESFERLAGAFDLVLVEGAGSAAETNLRARDIANMGFARRAGVPVCLLADIDRGGVIASVVGTRAVLDPADAAMVRSFAINKFRGDPALFEDGVRDIERHTGWPCRGVVPWLEAARRLPPEDAVVLDRPGGGGRPAGAARAGDRVRIVAPRLSRIANFDDVDPPPDGARRRFRLRPAGLAAPARCRRGGAPRHEVDPRRSRVPQVPGVGPRRHRARAKRRAGRSAFAAVTRCSAGGCAIRTASTDWRARRPVSGSSTSRR